jgi:hypothetical protein
MATTNIQAEVVSLTGVSSVTANFLESSQKFVASNVPKNYMWGHVGRSTPATANPISLGTKSDSVMAVIRGSYHCGEIEQKYRGTVEANDTASLYFPTHRHPKFVKNHNNTYSVYPSPKTANDNSDVTDHNAGEVSAYVLFVDPSKIDDDSDLRNAVVYYTASKEFSKKSISKIIDWTTISLPTSIPSPAFGVQLSISTTPPTVPVLSKQTIDTSDWVAPSYVSPDLQLADFPTIYWNFPTSPVAPSIASNSVADYSSVTPVFTPPAAPQLDFTSAQSYVTNEDPEMVQSQTSLINSQLSEYQAKMGEAQAKFNEQQQIYQATISTNTQEAQLLEGFEGRKMSKFQAEMSKYQQDINKIIQENQSVIQAWTQEHGTKVQDYQARISSAMNQFNKENAEYQAMINKASQNAQFSQANEGQKLSSYQAELSQYQQDTQKEITTFQQNLSQDNQEYSAQLQKFQADLGKANAQSQQLSTEVNTNLAQANFYEKESTKYYQWANGEIQRFISNNERTTSRALSAQAMNK